CQQSRKVPWTF
nr:immunoglobulin light chain junction region [Mus musculus]NSL97156.1 immunoglobulin light chain junction region [Mus musculus]NSL97218.1 immunoglobulin light chain junction region [Mus musculus]NSL97227.1 immunoglobulin light chain junction region [Mus musculus]NSL97246.1 immunoglobulin light chain junction region [Mus musculus]